MAESRRIPITTVGPLKKDKRPKESAPTPRFSLVLLESNDKTCPEFNYNDLLGSNNGSSSSGRKSIGASEYPAEGAEDPFPDDQEDEKLRALAKKFEDKYRPRLSKKQKKKIGRMEDYIDLGMGYDENDPFIDNTDAYDELVPSTLTTQLGGFYINSGKLSFKEVQSDSSDDGSMNGTTRKRHRKSKDYEKEGKRRRRLNKDGEDIPKRRGRKVIDGALKHKKSQSPAVVMVQQKAQQQSSTIDPNNGVAEGRPGPSSVHETIESVINASRDHDSNDLGRDLGSSDSDMAIGLSADREDELPKGLPHDLDDLIHLIKEAALRNEEGKCKFFSVDVNNMLLSIELKSREIQCSQRTMIYAHLAHYLPCSKETLLKRAKKLRLDQVDDKLKVPMAKLKEAIDLAMPACCEKYSEECVVFQRKQKEVEMRRDAQGNLDGMVKSETPAPPRRVFRWTAELRKLLCDVVAIKLKCFEVSRIRGQSSEVYLRQFLEDDVKPLWPKDWMYTKVLYKESSSVHAQLTNKPRKSAITAIKKLSIGSSPSATETTFSKPVMSLNGLVQHAQSSNPTVTSTPPSAVVAAAAAAAPRVKTPSVPGESSVLIAVTTSTTTPTSTSLLTVAAAKSLAISVTTTSTANITITATTVAASVATTAAATSTQTPAVTVIASGTNTVGKSTPSVIEKPTLSVSIHPSNSVAISNFSPVKQEPTTPSTTTSPVTIKTEPSKSSAIPITTIPISKYELSFSSPTKLQEPTPPPPPPPPPPLPVLPRQSVDNVSVPRNTSVDSITVTSLLKHSNASLPPSSAGALAHDGSRMFSLLDYAEPVQKKPMEATTPNDVLSQIIHASLGNFPNSGNSKNSPTSLGTSFGSSSDFSINIGKTIGNVASSMLSSYGSVGKSSPSSAQSNHNQDSKSASLRSQVSLLKNPPSSTKGDNSVIGGSSYQKLLEQPRTLNSAVKPREACVELKQHNTLSLSHHKSSYSMPQDRTLSKAYTSPLQSTFEFEAALERSLQERPLVNTSPKVSAPPPSGGPLTYRKEPKDVSLGISPYPYPRKELAELSQRDMQLSSMSRKDLANEQPLNFSRHSSTSVPSSSAASCANALSVITTMYNSRVSPVSAGYHSPLKEGSKSHVLPSHVPGRTANLPHVSYPASVNSNSVRLVASSKGVSDSAYSNTSSHLSTSPPTALSTSQIRPHINLSASSTSPNIPNHSHSTANSSQSSKILRELGLDLSQVPSVMGASWCGTGATSPLSSSPYSRHYAKLLPPSAAPSSPLGTKQSDLAGKSGITMQQHVNTPRRPTISSTTPSSPYNNQNQGY